MKIHRAQHVLIAASLLALGAPAFATTVEAESQTLASGAVVRDSAGVSGGKYVNSNGMTFRVAVDSTGIYDLSIKMWVKQYDWFNSSIFINNSPTAVASFLTNSPSLPFTSYTLATSAKLTAGSNTIAVTGGTANFDALTLVRQPPVVFQLDATPVTANATVPAQKLKTFLTRNFGTRTIAGMMIGDNAFNYDYGNMRLITKCVASDSCKVADSLTTFLGQEDIRLFKERSGEHPALGGFDQLFATGGHSDEGWFRGYTDNNLRMAKQLWDLGGIPAFTWHWKVGEDTVFYVKNSGFRNAGCTEGVQGTSADNSCFNYTKAFVGATCTEPDTASVQYKAIVADLDKISVGFRYLQDSGVAAIWRPVHEAAGGWFWWGIGGSDCYKSLYRLVYDRMVRVNGVRNLIWVWNIERDPKIGYDHAALNPAWYPGDDVVDVIGVDIYNNAGDLKSSIASYSKIVASMGTRKILALTENGPIPDVDSMAIDGAVWSWWMPWYNTWGSGFLNQTPDAAWAKNLKDPRIISLGDMPGWASYSTKASPKASRVPSDLGVAVRGRALVIRVAEATTVTLFDHRGKTLATHVQGPGTATYSLKDLTKGLYLVQLDGKLGREARRVMVY